MSTAGESEMCYSLWTSIGDVTRLNVANVVRVSLYAGGLRTHARVRSEIPKKDEKKKHSIYEVLCEKVNDNV